MTIEETFEELDKLLSVMEDRNTTLEDAFSSYEQGMKLVKECNASLDTVEKKIMEIQLQNGAAEEDE